MSNKEKLQQAFINWDKTNKFWQTSDGECFFTEPRAIKHAQKLEDKTVKPYRRADVIKEQEETPEKSVQSVSENTKKAEPKSEAPAEKSKPIKKTK